MSRPRKPRFNAPRKLERSFISAVPESISQFGHKYKFVSARLDLFDRNVVNAVFERIS